MNPSQLQTRAEKILTPIAWIFSLLLWLTLIVGMLAPLLFFSRASLPEPCVFIYEDEYRVFTPDEAKQYQAPCLPRSEIPDEVYGNAKKYMKEKPSPRTIATGVSFVIFFYISLILLFIYVTTALGMAYIRLNGVRIGPDQYPQFYEIYEKTAKELGLKEIPHAYIIHADGALNAFAVKVSRKKMVVFFSELIEALVEGEKFNELTAVAAHELTHVKLKHIHYWILLMPFRFLPLLGSFFSRSREFSADRGALAIMKHETTVTQALIKLAAGKFVAKEINVDVYIDQLRTERGFFVWLAKLTASHPPIPARIKRIRACSKNESFSSQSSAQSS